MPQQRPDVLTPVTVAELYDALADAWRDQLGEEPPRPGAASPCTVQYREHEGPS